MRVERLGHALRQHHLHDVAFGDVVLGLEHSGLEFGFAKQRYRWLGRHQRGADLRRYGRRMQSLLQPFEQLTGTGKGVRLRGVGIMHQRQLAGQVIDDGQRFYQHEQNIRRTQRVRMHPLGQTGLNVTDGVVTENTDQATTEARQMRLLRHLETGLIGGNVVQRVRDSACINNLTILDARDFVTTHTQSGVCWQSDKGITAEALTPLHRFEEKGVRGIAQLEIERERCFQIGQGFQRDRYAVIARISQAQESRLGARIGRTNGMVRGIHRCSPCAKGGNSRASASRLSTNTSQSSALIGYPSA